MGPARPVHVIPDAKIGGRRSRRAEEEPCRGPSGKRRLLFRLGCGSILRRTSRISPTLLRHSLLSVVAGCAKIWVISDESLIEEAYVAGPGIEAVFAGPLDVDFAC